jgi:hypothetical protein
MVLAITLLMAGSAESAERAGVATSAMIHGYIFMCTLLQ